MNCLIWNCQGIVNNRTRYALKSLIQKHKACLVFLSETHCTKQQHESLLRSVGLSQIAHFDRVDRAGGLALMWDASITVNVRRVDRYFIDALVKGPDDVEWRFTGFYGHPETGQRHLSWDLLRSLVRNPRERWVVAGDFNEILELGEKSGGRLRSLGQMQAFRRALTDCYLEDMGAAGGLFTWWDSGTKERLDRCTASSAWRADFGFSRVVHLHPSRSDHVPLLLEVRRNPPVHERRRRQFRFEEMWCSHEGFAQKVEEAWSEPYTGDPMLYLCRKLKGVGHQLLSWDRTVFQNRRNEVAAVRSQLNDLLQKPFDPADHEAKLQLSEKLNELMSMDETYWRQRSRAIWLKEGNRNTKYFHKRASNRRQKNRIKGLFYQDGSWQESPVGIEKVILEYFQSVFSSQPSDTAAQDRTNLS